MLEDKDVTEEIKSLSPEAKAYILHWNRNWLMMMLASAQVNKGEIAKTVDEVETELKELFE